MFVFVVSLLGGNGKDVCVPWRKLCTSLASPPRQRVLCVHKPTFRVPILFTRVSAAAACTVRAEVCVTSHPSTQLYISRANNDRDGWVV